MDQIIRSQRKTIALQLRPDGTLVIRAPLRATRGEIQAVVDRHRGWIEKHRAQLAARPAEPPFSPEELEALAGDLAARLPDRLARFAPLVGVDYGRVTVRSQRTRWGSCSGKGNLNFNCLLALAPPEVLDYVVVHELCHRRHMDHSPAFWAEVARVLPDYRTSRAWLKTQGQALIRRLAPA